MGRCVINALLSFSFVADTMVPPPCLLGKKHSRNCAMSLLEADRMSGALSDRRDLTENLPFSFQPIIERVPVPIAPLTVKLIGTLRD